MIRMSADAIKLLKPRVFDKSKWMQLPRDVVIGHDVLGQLPAVCEDLKLGPSALLVSGRGTMKLAGTTVKKILSGGYTVKTFIAEEITAPVIKKGEKAAKGADFLIGVGGGRVIDTAKIVSFNLDLPFISVPTAASHDGIASARASVAVEGGNSSLEAQPPVAIVADTGIIASAPHRLLAADVRPRGTRTRCSRPASTSWSGSPARKRSEKTLTYPFTKKISWIHWERSN